MNATDPSIALLGYTILGFGFRGGFRHWSPGFKLIYVMVFPAHELFFTVLEQNRSTVKAIWRSEYFHAFVILCVVLYINYKANGGR